MVGKWGVSDDKLTYTFELRDGLKFSDGAPVTAADCVASVRRWAARDGAGQRMMKRVKDTPVVDDKTFRIVLSEPYGLVIDSLSTISTSLCYMMRKKDAETDPNQQITRDDRLRPVPLQSRRDAAGQPPRLRPQPELRSPLGAASAMAGGKVVKLDRVTFENIADEQTALCGAAGRRNRLLRGSAAGPGRRSEEGQEPHRSGAEQDRPRRADAAQSSVSAVQQCRCPQGDALSRQAGRRDARDLRPAEIWQACGSYFACGTPMTNDENTDWFKHGQDIAKAKELFQKARL